MAVGSGVLVLQPYLGADSGWVVLSGGDTGSV
jgi:hypothetical protein